MQGQKYKIWCANEPEGCIINQPGGALMGLFNKPGGARVARKIRSAGTHPPGR